MPCYKIKPNAKRDQPYSITLETTHMTPYLCLLPVLVTAVVVVVVVAIIATLLLLFLEVLLQVLRILGAARCLACLARSSADHIIARLAISLRLLIVRLASFNGLFNGLFDGLQALSCGRVNGGG